MPPTMTSRVLDPLSQTIQRAKRAFQPCSRRGTSSCDPHPHAIRLHISRYHANPALSEISRYRQVYYNICGPRIGWSRRKLRSELIN